MDRRAILIHSLRKRGKTFEEIGLKIGLSREGVRKIEKNHLTPILGKHFDFIEKPCKCCGKKIKTKEYINKVFCSKKCFHLYPKIKPRYCFKCKKNENLMWYRKKANLSICRSCNTKIMRKYIEVYDGRKNINKNQRKSSQRHKIECKARKLVQMAVLRGELEKPLKCSKCLMETAIEGHHPDYSKPLKVVWLCRSCHSDLHKGL